MQIITYCMKLLVNQIILDIIQRVCSGCNDYYLLFNRQTGVYGIELVYKQFHLGRYTPIIHGSAEHYDIGLYQRLQYFVAIIIMNASVFFFLATVAITAGFYGVLVQIILDYTMPGIQ